MFRWKELFGLLVLLSLCAGCAKVQAYRPAPIAPVATARRLESRSLSDPGLEKFLQANLRSSLPVWPLRRWDLRTLTYAALYFNPQIAVAREQMAVTKAAIITAGEKPNPTFKLTPGIPSPYLLNVRLRFPIETHGRRRLRIEQAQRLYAAARLMLAETEWNAASAVRKALLGYEMDRRLMAAGRATARIETRRVTLLKSLVAAGEGARPALETARVALSNERLAIREEEGRFATDRATLAGALGVPVEALDGVAIAWPEFGRLPSIASLSPPSLRREAVFDRLDVRRALEQYAAADAALRLQLARQYPNFNIGPGYSYSDPYSNFTIPFNIILPIRNRNQGPIAQAAAFRKEMAANFLALQAQAIARSEQALAAYRAALGAFAESSRPYSDQQRRIRTGERMLAEGESGRLPVNALQLEGEIYSQQQLQALGQAQAALGALEDAVERPLGPDVSIFPARARTAAAQSRKESGR